MKILKSVFGLLLSLGVLATPLVSFAQSRPQDNGQKYTTYIDYNSQAMVELKNTDNEIKESVEAVMCNAGRQWVDNKVSECQGIDRDSSGTGAQEFRECLMEYVSALRQMTAVCSIQSMK